MTRNALFTSFGLAGLLCLLAATAPAIDDEERPMPYLLNMAWLAQAKSGAASGDPELQFAMEALRKAADKALGRGPYSVTDKTLMPPSGDKQDYLSYAPYWWPNPDTENGLPYVRRDGEANPESRTSATDRKQLGAMMDAVVTLGLAYYFFEQESHAEHAARLLRVWFLDPDTRMNPNLNHGQAVPGRDDGRCYGIIETRGLVDVIDVTAFLAASPAWTPADASGLRAWFADYLHWLRTSELGVQESRTINNHATWYDVQVTSFALYTGDVDLARDTVASAKTRRVERQIEPDGTQPHELARTKTFDYSVMNLIGMFALARLGEHVDVDLWSHVSQDGRGLRPALDFLAPYADPQREWPHLQITKHNRSRLLPLLQQAVVVYDAQAYRLWLDRLAWPEIRGQRSLLLYPAAPARTK